MADSIRNIVLRIARIGIKVRNLAFAPDRCLAVWSNGDKEWGKGPELVLASAPFRVDLLSEALSCFSF